MVWVQRGPGLGVGVGSRTSRAAGTSMKISGGQWSAGGHVCKAGAV